MVLPTITAPATTPAFFNAFFLKNPGDVSVGGKGESADPPDAETCGGDDPSTDPSNIGSSGGEPSGPCGAESEPICCVDGGITDDPEVAELEG